MSINERFNKRATMLHLDVANIDTDAAYYVPYIQDEPGVILKAAVCNDAQTSTNTCTVQLAISGTDVTGGLMTIASGAAAGAVTSCAPTAKNRVSPGQAIRVTFGGSSGGSSRGHVCIMVAMET